MEGASSQPSWQPLAHAEAGEELAPIVADPELGSQGWQVPRQHHRRLVFRAAGALLVLGVLVALLLASHGKPSGAIASSHTDMVVLDGKAPDRTLLMARELARAAAALRSAGREAEDTDHLPEGEDHEDLPEGKDGEDDLPEGVPEAEDAPTSAPNSSMPGADELPEGDIEDHLPEGEEPQTPSPNASKHGADDLSEGGHLPEGEEPPTPSPHASKHGSDDLPEGGHLPEGEEAPTVAPNASKSDADDLPEGGDDHLPEGDDDHLSEGDDHLPEGDDDHLPEGDDNHLPEGDDDHLPEGDDDRLPEGDDDHLPEGEETETAAPSPSPTPSPQANLCPDGAELHINYCYKTCASLTQGKYPYRLNSITCCKNNTDCSTEGMINPDFGELVSPQQSDGCLPDEEYLGGLCYKACSLITGGDYPYRMDARTCCKKSGYWSCRLPQNRKRSSHFDIGGGGGCPDDTELRGHFCYKKCSILTDGEYPKRKGPMMCCKQRHCHWPGYFETSHRFNVGGDLGCPKDEELHASRCFKRCDLLTNGTYPARVAVATCCKELDTRLCGLHNTLWTDLRFGEGSHPSNQPVHVPAGRPRR